MKILVATTINLTVEAFLLEQLTHLRSEGHEVVVLACGVPEAHPVSGVRTIEAPWSRRLRPIATLSAIAKARGIIERERPDVLYIHTTIAASITRLALRRRRRCRVVYCAHGFDGAQAQPAVRRIVARGVERYLARRTDLILTMNDEDTHWAMKLRCETVRIPSVGLDLAFYRPCPLRTRTTPYRLLAVAELAPRKRPLLLIDTITALPDTYSLVIVGDGPLHDAIEAHARSRGVRDRVVLTGRLDDVRPKLCEADVCISTSRQEGLPRSLLEAAASGIPVAGMDARGVSDIIRQCGGRTVKDGDVEGLAEAVQSLIADSASYEQARLDGIEGASQHDVSVLAPRICQLVLAGEASSSGGHIS